MKRNKYDQMIFDKNNNRTIIFVMAASHVEYERFVKGDCLNMPDGIVFTFLNEAIKLRGFVRNAMVIRLPGCFHHPNYREIEREMIGLGVI